MAEFLSKPQLDAIAERFVGRQVAYRAGEGDRLWLGDVRRVVVDGSGMVRLEVEHFNGDPWPWRPPADEVEILR